MIVKIAVYAWRCMVCGHIWLPDKDVTRKLRCPNRKCRKLATYTGVVKDG